VLLQPLSDAGDRALVSVRRRVRAVKDPYLTKQNHGHTTAFSLGYFSPEFNE
jgi:hypothetical protein